MSRKVSVVIPVFGSPATLNELVKRLEAAVSGPGHELEILLIDDGGPPENWAEIERLSQAFPSVVGVRLSRNFGQHQAITAGFDHASGDVVVVMDCDLQDPPEAVPDFLQALDEGADIAIGTRAVEPAGLARRLLHRIYFRMLSILSGTRIRTGQGSFSAVTRQVAMVYSRLRDVELNYLLALHWLGFEVVEVAFPREERREGKTTYTFWKLIRHALTGVIFQSTRLLYAATVAGIVFSILAMLLGAFFIVQTLVGRPPEGWASTVVLILLVGGANLVAVGVLGIYVARIFDQVRARPRYIVRDQTPSGDSSASDRTTRS